MNKKKIVFISSGQPSLNPRLVKEADALSSVGYEVTVLYSYWNNWGTEMDKYLIPIKRWKAIRVGGDPQQQAFIYFLSRLIHKLAKIINRNTRGKLFPDVALARSAYFLLRTAKKSKADLYIGHNLGALAATVEAAKINKKPTGFDAEDFHRNEVSSDVTNPDVVLKSRIEDIYMPQVDYLSASSPLITEAYKTIFPTVTPVTILNVFPTDSRILPPSINNSGAVRLFWFSQTIGINRGLESVLTSLKILSGKPFELHLLGHLSQEMKDILDGYKDSLNIHLYKPILPDEIPLFASQFDIGLAAENNAPLNRDICLTNKIFTYLSAGLAVVASNTKAQTELIKQYPLMGKLYQAEDPQSLADLLLYYHANRNELIKTREAAFEIAGKKLCWENESKKFITLVEQTIKNFE